MDSTIAGAIIGASGAIIAAVLGTVGVMIANNLRHQITLRITERRLQAYATLWQKMKVASPMRLCGPDPKPLTSQERKKLYNNFTSWYYENGNGMLLGEETRNLYLCAKKNLDCPFDKIEPKSLQTEKRKTDEGRGRLSVRQLSLLRTRMKADLEIYGSYFFGKLEPDDKVFLEHCRQRLDRKPWRSKGIVETLIETQDA